LMVCWPRREHQVTPSWTWRLKNNCHLSLKKLESCHLEITKHLNKLKVQF
jgi:hypothetical protein